MVAVVTIVSIVGRAPVPGIVIPGGIVPGIIPAPGAVVTVIAPRTIIPGIPVPGIPIGPGTVIPGAVVSVQIPGPVVPGIIPAVTVHYGDVRTGIVETELRSLALRDDDGVALRAEHIYFGFDGFLHEGVHLFLGNGGHGSLRTGIRVDAVFELLRGRSILRRQAAGCRGGQGQQPGSQVCFHLLNLQFFQ